LLLPSVGNKGFQTPRGQARNGAPEYHQSRQASIILGGSIPKRAFYSSAFDGDSNNITAVDRDNQSRRGTSSP
jgi:hypothetical protein